MSGAMTRAEREELSKVLRQRARVAGKIAEQRKAELTADVEAQLAAVYRSDQAMAKDLTDRAQAAVAAADAELAERCRELGIPETFRPSLNLSWASRGENGFDKRRAELRRVAVTRIDALAKRAAVEIETKTLDLLVQLAADGLESEAAQKFLAALPTVETLMPQIDLTALPMPEKPKRIDSERWGSRDVDLDFDE